jgi:hypothetical protein
MRSRPQTQRRIRRTARSESRSPIVGLDAVSAVRTALFVVVSGDVLTKAE